MMVVASRHGEVRVEEATVVVGWPFPGRTTHHSHPFIALPAFLALSSISRAKDSP